MLLSKQKILTAGLLTSTLLLAACSDNADNNTSDTSATAIKKSLKSLDDSNSHEGVWGFCNDKKAAVTTGEESCQTIDASVWHLADGELTALDVTNTATEGCTTACFNVNDDALQTTVAAKGYYEYDETGYSFTITESSDEKRFPICTVNWNVSSKLSDELVQWSFENVDCEMPEINYSAWAKKYTGVIN